jgi:hypothetical protein
LIRKETLIAIAIAAVFFYIVLGMAGLRTAAGLVLLFFVPFYLILDYFEIDNDEKIIFAFVLGIGLYSGLAYYLGIILHSLRWGMLIAFLLLMGLGIFAQKKKSKPNTNQGQDNSLDNKGNAEKPQVVTDSTEHSKGEGAPND